MTPRPAKRRDEGPSHLPNGGLAARVMLRLVDFVAARGHDPEVLCRDVGLSLSALREPGARVPYGAVEPLCERAAALVGDPNLGLHLAQSVREAIPDDPGLLMLMASPTIRVSLEHMVRYQRFWGDGARTALVPLCVGVCVRFALSGTTELVQRHADECAMAEVVVGLRALSSREVTARAVRFRHAAPGDTREHEALFRCPLEFGAAHTELELSHETLDAPLPHANEVYRAIFERQVERALAALPAEGGVAESVREAARAMLAGGGCTLSGTARVLGVSERTMQRQLRKHGTSFGALVDALRCEMAVAYLERGVAVAEIAFLLGYGETSAFHHAFKRWTDKTPERFRAAR